MLESINNIGPKTQKALNNLGIYTKEELLNYYPYKYNLYKIVPLANTNPNETIVVTGKVESLPKIHFIKKNLNRLTFSFNEGNKLINVSIFNRGFIKNKLTIGKEITIIGKYNSKTNNFTANDIKLTPMQNNTIEPVYHLNKDIKKTTFKKIISNLLNEETNIKNIIPDELIRKYDLISRKEAIKEIHNPTSNQKLKQATLHLIYEELLIFTLKINYLKKQKNESNATITKVFDESKLINLINNLPFKLTDDQVKAIEDIKKDFNLPKRMNRLILGDVGSGMTIISFISLYINYLSGYQGVLMAPT